MMETHGYDFKRDPVLLLEALSGHRGCFLLESSVRQAQRGRYSYVGFDPFTIVEGNDLKAFLRLEKMYRRFSAIDQSPRGFFSSGLVGYVSYDFGLGFERITPGRRQADLPGFVFGFYDCVIRIDHFENKILVASSGLPETTGSLRKKRAKDRLTRVKKMIESLSPHKGGGGFPGVRPVNFKSNFSKTGYCNAVKKALNYIKRGDIYQVNLAQKFSCRLDVPAEALEVYKNLRVLSPSCYSGYFDCGPFQVVSSSPEMFLSLKNGFVETRPMKGTRPRGKNPGEDYRRRLELQKNAKENAELLMVTDLERNDLGRVCDFGSVKVKKIREIEKYQTVFQATSTVTGQLAKDKNGFDLLKACFPGGSVSGCPKIRAMQIIEELEPSARGIYTGALGYMGFNGDLAFNVLIRTLVVAQKNVSFYVGSGIVADSQPLMEYEETLLKARALKESLQYENVHHLSRRRV